MKSISLFAAMFLSIVCFSQKIIQTKENTLIPEGIAIHPKSGDIYISSIAKHKIIKIDSKNTAEDFITEGQSDLLEVLGMKVDVKRNILWCLSNKRNGKWFTSQIHGFDLNSKEKKYHHVLKDTIPHLLNDLVLDRDANLIITDTYFSGIYKFSPAANQLDLIIKSAGIKYPNGLVFGKNQKLYVASYGTGMLQVNLNTKDIKPLKGYKDSLLAHGLDGLEYRKGFLYGVYNAGNGRPTDAVVKYVLDEKDGRIINESILDRGNKHFYDPTTTALYKKKLYVIANSHLDQFNKNKESIKGIEDSLLPLTILVYDIKR